MSIIIKHIHKMINIPGC